MSLPSEFTPEAVTAWVVDLPYANKAVLSRETFELISALSRQKLVSGDRMEILEAMVRPVDIVLDHLNGQIIGEHPKAPLFLSLGEEYCRLMSLAYRGVVDDLSASRTGFFNERAIIAAVTRAGEYLERRLLLRALVHHAAPTGDWEAMKTLYFGSKERHRAPFYRAIALHLSGTNRLSPGDILKVQALLEKLPVERLIELNAPVDGATTEGFFLPAGDTPPRYGVVPADARPLQMGRLLGALDGLRGRDLDARIVQDLSDHWSTSQRAKARRVAPTKRLRTRAVFGFHDILRCLRDTTVAVTDSNPAGGEEVAMESGEWSFGAVTRHAVAHSVDVLDISDQGCRLRCRHAGAKSGDVVAVQWGGGAWRVGTVAWFISDGDDWVIGLHWLVEHPHPIRVRFDSPEPIWALRGRHLVSRQQVLLHVAVHGSYRATCRVQEPEGWRRVRLSVVERRGPVEVARTEAVAEEQLKSAQPAPVADKPSAVAPFAEVWEALSPYSGSASVHTHGPAGGAQSDKPETK